jgi:SAM-dependent methyltransferase
MSGINKARLLRQLIASQIYLSRAFDRMLPELFRVDGYQDFLHCFAPRYLQANSRLYDVGGGKVPFLSQCAKSKLEIFTVGLDIDENELRRAPKGAYDETVCADIATYVGRGDGDLVIAMAVLEHVKHVEDALASISGILKNGGRAVIFVPSRNALYARMNLLLPQSTKRRLLSLLRGRTSDAEGFRAYYDRCTLKDFAEIGRHHKLEVIEERSYFASGYFSLFFPAYVVWRIWMIFFYIFKREQAAETFCIAFEKRAS